MNYRVIVAAAWLALAGCAAATSSMPNPTVPSGDRRAATVRFDVSIPVPQSAAARHRMFVSSGTNGIGISYGASPATFPGATTPTVSFNVSGSSTLCHTSGSTRTCSLEVPALVGTDDFQITAWSAAPVGGSFSGANMLSNATVTNASVVFGVANTENVTLDGIVAKMSLTYTNGLSAELLGGTTETTDLKALCYDASGALIVGGFYDASGNSISFTVAQTALTGNDTIRTTLQSGSLTSSTSELQVTYSGGGTWGTRFTPTASETLSGGVTGTPIVVTPLVTNDTISGSSEFIALGPDGNPWFTEYSTGNVGTTTISGTVTEYPLPTASAYPQGIASGSDGNLWVAEYLTGKIAKVTTSGTVTEYPLPSATSHPFDVTLGPDDNLWFTENTGNKVGKITTSGSITEYAVGPSTGANYQPDYIVSGPDGNLWFTEIGNNSVCKIKTSGTYTCYTLPTSDSWPQAIMVGSDGNLWLNEYTTFKLAKVTTSGSITEYSGYAESNLMDGPDANIWASGSGGTDILTTSVTEYSSTSLQGAMTTTSGGVVWFDGNNDKITRYVY